MDRYLPSNHLSGEIGLGTRIRMLTVSDAAAVWRVADELKAQNCPMDFALNAEGSIPQLWRAFYRLQIKRCYLSARANLIISN